MSKYLIIFLSIIAISASYELVPCPATLPISCECFNKPVCVLFKDPSCPFNFCGRNFDSICHACYEKNVYQYIETPCEELDSSIPKCGKDGQNSKCGSDSSDQSDYEATIHEQLGTSGGPVLNDDNIIFPHFHGNPQLKRK